MRYCEHCGQSLDDPAAAPLSFGDLELRQDSARRWSLACRGVAVPVTVKEAEVLGLLAKRRQVSGEVLRAVLFPEAESRTHQMHISRLRRAFKVLGSKVTIATAAGRARPAFYWLDAAEGGSSGPNLSR